MGRYIEPTAAICLVCFGLWFFQDAMSETILDAEAIRMSVVENTVLQVGTKEPCIAKVHLSVWDSMNQLEVYRWVVECEDTTNDQPE
jgi:hypothetical protein